MCGKWHVWGYVKLNASNAALLGQFFVRSMALNGIVYVVVSRRKNSNQLLLFKEEFWGI